MVDDSHEKDNIEADAEQSQMFDAEQIDGQVPAPGHAVQGGKAVVVLNGGLEAEDQSRLLSGHAKHIVAVVAANVGDDLIVEVGENGLQPLPFAVAAPLGIDFDTEDRKGTLAPGHEGPEILGNQLPLAFSFFLGQADNNLGMPRVEVAGRVAGEAKGRIAKTAKALFVLVDPGLAPAMFLEDGLAVGLGGQEIKVGRVHPAIHP